MLRVVLFLALFSILLFSVVCDYPPESYVYRLQGPKFDVFFPSADVPKFVYFIKPSPTSVFGAEEFTIEFVSLREYHWVEWNLTVLPPFNSNEQFPALPLVAQEFPEEFAVWTSVFIRENNTVVYRGVFGNNASAEFAISMPTETMTLDIPLAGPCDGYMWGESTHALFSLIDPGVNDTCKCEDTFDLSEGQIKLDFTVLDWPYEPLTLGAIAAGVSVNTRWGLGPVNVNKTTWPGYASALNFPVCGRFQASFDFNEEELRGESETMESEDEDHCDDNAGTVNEEGINVLGGIVQNAVEGLDINTLNNAVNELGDVIHLWMIPLGQSTVVDGYVTSNWGVQIPQHGGSITMFDPDLDVLLLADSEESCNDGDDKLSTGAIVGIVVGGLAAICTICVLCIAVTIISLGLLAIISTGTFSTWRLRKTVKVHASSLMESQRMEVSTGDFSEMSENKSSDETSSPCDSDIAISSSDS